MSHDWFAVGYIQWLEQLDTASRLKLSKNSKNCLVQKPWILPAAGKILAAHVFSTKPHSKSSNTKCIFLTLSHHMQG